MLKVITQAIIGITLLAGGIALTIFYLDGLSSGTGKDWIIGIIVVLITVGLFFLIKAGRLDMFRGNIQFSEEPALTTKSKFKETGKLIQGYEKAQEMQDRMKVLEIEAKAEEQREKGAGAGV